MKNWRTGLNFYLPILPFMNLSFRKELAMGCGPTRKKALGCGGDCSNCHTKMSMAGGFTQCEPLNVTVNSYKPQYMDPQNYLVPDEKAPSFYEDPLVSYSTESEDIVDLVESTLKKEKFKNLLMYGAIAYIVFAR